MSKQVALSLGYPSLKEEQQMVIVKFVQGEDVFAVLAKVCAVFDTLEDSSGSVVVAITPLAAI